MAQSDQPTDHESHFVPRFIEFVAAGIFGVGIHRAIYDERANGAVLIVMGIALFASGHFWNRITQNAPKRFKATARNTVWDFRVWLAMVLLLASYFAVFPLPQQHLMPDDAILTSGWHPEGAPLGIDWTNAGFLTGGGPQPQKIIEFGLTAKNVDMANTLTLHDAFMISNMTGQRIEGTVNTNPFPELSISNTAPVPPNTWLQFHFKFINGAAAEQIAEEWKAFSLEIEYDGQKLRHTFSSDDVARMLTAVYPQSAPHVTARQ